MGINLLMRGLTPQPRARRVHMRTTPATIAPTLQETYYPGETLQLYSHPPPPVPTKEEQRCPYDEPLKMLPSGIFGGSPLVETLGRYTESVNERITLPHTPPDVSIILEKCLHSSTRNITHVWLARVQSSSQGTYPELVVAKIYDVVWFEDAVWYHPFKLRNRSVSQEVESYRRFEKFQGTKVPRFYGHFVAPLPTQENRTVNVVLMQYIPSQDLYHRIPPDVADTVCAVHKDTLIEAVLDLELDLNACGVCLLDMEPRNVILLPPKERRDFCTSPTCPLRFEADCEKLEIVMIDFEMVDLGEFEWAHNDRRALIDSSKPKMLRRWLG